MLIKAELIPGVRPKRFSAEGWKHYNVRIFVEPAEGPPLSQVEMVVYILDPSFEEERYVVSVDRRRQFEIDIWTYDFFDASANVLLKNDTYITVSGEIRWEGQVEARQSD